MSTASAYMTIRGIGIDVIYKDIKNLHIGVYPPMGRVRVAAPERLNDDAVRLICSAQLSRGMVSRPSPGSRGTGGSASSWSWLVSVSLGDARSD